MKRWMGTATCKDKCINEPVSHCTITHYLLGFRSCYVCGKAYDPKQRPNCKKTVRGGIRCYCCNNLMRTRPKNKEVWNKTVGVVWQ